MRSAKPANNVGRNIRRNIRTRNPALWATRKFVLNFRKHHEIPEYDGLVIVDALTIAHDWLAMDRMLQQRDRVVRAAICLHRHAPWGGKYDSRDYLQALKELDRAIAELPSGIYDSAVSDYEGKRPARSRDASGVVFNDEKIRAALRGS